MKRNTNSTNKGCKRYELLVETIDKLERGVWTGSLDVHWCCDSITWLWKWKKITEDQKNSLCDRMIELMS